MYIVTVRQMSSMLLWKSVEMTGIAGKYMLAVPLRGLICELSERASAKQHICYGISNSPEIRSTGCKDDFSL